MTRRGLFGLLAGTATATAKPTERKTCDLTYRGEFAGTTEPLRWFGGLQLDPYRLTYGCSLTGDYEFDGPRPADLDLHDLCAGYGLAINGVLVRNAVLADKARGFALCRPLQHICEWWQRVNGRSEREPYRIIRGRINFVWWPDRLHEAGRESKRSRALRKAYPFDVAAGSSFLPNLDAGLALFEFSRAELESGVNWDLVLRCPEYVLRLQRDYREAEAAQIERLRS